MNQFLDHLKFQITDPETEDKYQFLVKQSTLTQVDLGSEYFLAIYDGLTIQRLG